VQGPYPSRFQSLRRSEPEDQATAMKITGHRTLSVFQRYGIVSTEQLHAAMTRFRTSENDAKCSPWFP